MTITPYPNRLKAGGAAGEARLPVAGGAEERLSMAGPFVVRLWSDGLDQG